MIKNYDRYTFFEKNRKRSLLPAGGCTRDPAKRRDGRNPAGKPLERLKEYYSEFDIVKRKRGVIFFSGGLVGNLGIRFCTLCGSTAGQ